MFQGRASMCKSQLQLNHMEIFISFKPTEELIKYDQMWNNNQLILKTLNIELSGTENLS